MRKTLVFSFVLVCAVYLSAQTGGGSGSGSGSSAGQSSTSGQNPSSGQTPTSDQGTTESQSSKTGQTSEHGGGHKVKGCLSGSSGNYTITDKSGNTYQLTGDTSKLADHVGHMVEISGTPASSSEGASSGATSGAGTSGAAGGSARTLSVTSVKHISASCSK